MYLVPLHEVHMHLDNSMIQRPMDIFASCAEVVLAEKTITGSPRVTIYLAISDVFRIVVKFLLLSDQNG